MARRNPSRKGEKEQYYGTSSSMNISYAVFVILKKYWPMTIKKQKKIAIVYRLIAYIFWTPSKDKFVTFNVKNCLLSHEWVHARNSENKCELWVSVSECLWICVLIIREVNLRFNSCLSMICASWIIDFSFWRKLNKFNNFMLLGIK